MIKIEDFDYNGEFEIGCYSNDNQDECQYVTISYNTFYQRVKDYESHLIDTFGYTYSDEDLICNDINVEDMPYKTVKEILEDILNDRA